MPPKPSHHAFRAWVVTFLAAAVPVVVLPTFFGYIRSKPGRVPWDPVLDKFSPVDLSTPIFIVLYGSLVLSLWSLIKRPALLLRGLQAYVLLLVLRMVSMALVTLEPPATLIPLIDPITQTFYPNAEPFTKDLFFSGHTATMFLLYLVLRGTGMRLPLLVATFFIGGAVLTQHVHWTVDVLFAPIAAWMAWQGSSHTLRWSGAVTSVREAA